MLFILLVVACKPAQHTAPGIHDIGSIGTEVGQAIMISDQLQGFPTANGDKYDSSKFTGAHKKVKFGAKVVVTNTLTGATVTVKIIDRGPIGVGHVIGLSKAAMKKLDTSANTLIPVRIRYKE
ncbi:MAG: septal ring lytic transglycosylase RlpA family protein [Bacteroidota bacterium]